jgi:hypothetical protein
VTRAGSTLTTRDRAELVDLFLGATEAVAPSISPDERSLLRDVIDRMLLDWDAPVNCD